MKNLLTIIFLLIAGLAFAQPSYSTITSDGSVVTIATPVNSKLIPVCNFNWIITDGTLKIWATGSNEVIPGGRLKYFTVSGVTDNDLKDEALGAISDQCDQGGGGGLSTLYLEDGTLLANGDTIPTTSGACQQEYWASGDTTFVRFDDCTVDTVLFSYTESVDTVEVDSANGQLIFTWEGDIDNPDTITLPRVVSDIVYISGQATPVVNMAAAEIFNINYSGQTNLGFTFSNLVAGEMYNISVVNNLDSVLLPPNAIFTNSSGRQCPVNQVTTKSFTLAGYSDGSNFYISSSTAALTCYTFDATYDSILVYAENNSIPLPSFSVRLKQSELIRKLKLDNVWYKLDVFYNFYNDAATSAFSRLNWRDVYGDDNITEVGGMTWVASTGYNSNGTTGYLQTNWNPSTEGVKFTQNSACAFIDVQSPGTTGAKFNFGVSNFRLEQASNWKYLINNTSDQTTTGTSSTSGVRLINRSGASANQAYLNATSVHTGTATSTATGSSNLSLATFGSDPSFSTATTTKYRMFGAGGSLNSTEVTALQTHWTASL